MILCVDTREKPRAIKNILAEFERQEVTVVRRALTFADYWNPARPDVTIERKRDLMEVSANVTVDRKRFVREIERCNRAKCHMIILVEHGNQIRRLEDVAGWKNPRLKESPYAVNGERLFRIMKAMEIYYGVEWQFCNKQSTGRRIIELIRSDDG